MFKLLKCTFETLSNTYPNVFATIDNLYFDNSMIAATVFKKKKKKKKKNQIQAPKFMLSFAIPVCLTMGSCSTTSILLPLLYGN